MLDPKEEKLLGSMLSSTSKGDETPSSLGPDKASFVLGLTYAKGLVCQRPISQTWGTPTSCLHLHQPPSLAFRTPVCQHLGSWVPQSIRRSV